jgi:hypothetical protein
MAEKKEKDDFDFLAEASENVRGQLERDDSVDDLIFRRLSKDSKSIPYTIRNPTHVLSNNRTHQVIIRIRIRTFKNYFDLI